MLIGTRRCLSSEGVRRDNGRAVKRANFATGRSNFPGGAMGRRRDFLKAASGMVLAAGGAWAVHHAHAGGSVPGSPESFAEIFSSSTVAAGSSTPMHTGIDDVVPSIFVHHPHPAKP